MSETSRQPPPPAFSPTPDAVPRLQEALTRLVRAVFVRPDTERAMLELPILQITCLRLVAEHEGQKLRQLAAQLELPLATTSRLVDRLVQAGLVARHTNPYDRRAIQIGTTPQSRAILARHEAAREAHLTACVRRLTPAQIDAAVSGLDLIAEAAEQVLSERDTPR